MHRKFVHHFFRLLCGTFALLACGLLGIILWAIWSRGWPALSWQFFTEQIRLVGASGGIFYNLVGSGILLATAFLVAAPISVGLALLHGVYLRHHRHREKLALMLYVLNGMPSILFGLFGMILFVQYFGWGKSWLSGGLLLGFMILPTVTVSLMERISSIPEKYLDAASGMGLTKSMIIRSVVLPQSIGGLVTGSLIGLARAAGETAPIMFTATIFAWATFPTSIKESPVLSLPYHIFILAQDSFDPAVGGKLWGTALTLLLVVTGLSLIALPARLKLHEEAHHG